MKYIVVEFELGKEHDKKEFSFLNDALQHAQFWVRMDARHESEIWLDYESDDFCWEEIARVKSENCRAVVYQATNYQEKENEIYFEG